MLLFVYGTLMRGMRNHAMMKYGKGDSTHGRASVQGTLYHLGGFPGLRLEGTGLVYGELWRVTDESIPEFDRFEGVPHLYTREVVIATPLDSELQVYANTYVYATDPSEYAQPIEGGQWKE